MAETQTKTKKDLFRERLGAKYADMNFDDEEAMYGRINDDYDEYENSIKEALEREKKITDVFSNNPHGAGFLTDLAKGNDPYLAMIERMGIDGITDVLNNPEKKAAYAEANKKYLERVADEKRLTEEYEKNMGESGQMLEQIQQERGLSDEQVDAAMDMVIKIAHEAIVGKFTRETVDMALKAIGYDAAVDNARSEGNIAGRNARIEEKLRKQSGGDGMPVMGGANNAPREKQGESIFDIASRAR